MIHIQRPPDPGVLDSVRSTGIAAAHVAAREGDALDLSGYEHAKPELFRMQHNKCCYCEKLEEQAKYRDVEHYRPKATYWWLAWTWDNLLFSCIDCNREYKRDQFPLALGSVPLVADQAPPGGELPLIIDPTDGIDRTAEVEFRREKLQSVERWKPYGVTERGRTTIRVCGLDRPALLDLYGRHVNEAVRPRLQPVFAAAEAQNVKAVISAWSTATRSLLAPTRPFRALAHDALAALAGPLCKRYQLTLRRP